MITMVISSLGQSDPHFSLFEFNKLGYNPGFAGANQAICVSSIHRQQWVGFGEGRPQTTILNFDMPLDAISSGVGLNIIQESIGFYNDLYIYGNYAYMFELGYGSLGIGAKIGVINKSVDGDWDSPESLRGGQVFTDPAIPHMESKVAFDAGLGMFYRYDNLYAGLSVTHLLEPKFKFDIEKVPFLKRHFYLVGGYNYQLPSPTFELQPSIMLQTDAASVEVNLGAKLVYNKKFWGGLSYRYNDAIVPMVGVHLLNGLSFAYSYDLVLGDMSSYTSGSHELMIRYCFNASFNRTPGRYRSVRRL